MVSNATTLETLDIAISNIEGPISNVEWGKLCNLQDLYLTQNKLNGDISRVVEGLSNCSNTTLEFLGLAGNRLTGQFPYSLGHLKNLRILSISFNQISGTIPTSIEQLSRLEILDLGQSQLKGALPESIFNLTELTQLFLATNDWEGNLSQNDFARLHQLKFLAISCGERFSVNLSSEWIPPFSLTYIEIRKCAFGTKLPTWLKTQKQLHTNILSNGSVSDSIPPWLWTMCSQLQFLELSDNEIGGNLPRLVNFPSSQIWTADFYSSYSDGVVVDLSSNSFHGGIPPSLCSPPSLFWLRLSRNNLFGELPKSLSNCKSLLTLDIGENKISGTIPEWFGESLLSLQKLSMTENMIGGHIPPTLCQLFGLQILDLSHNNLTGSIPSCLGNLRGNKDMTYTFTLDLIDLSFNNLHGEIPNEITGLSSLGTLNLSWNQLSGRIPEDLGSMQQLETLDLSSNHLSGSIPLSMTSITTLSYLNLSYNNLGGPIPSKNQFGTFTNPSSFECNPELCGKPLITDCSPPRKRDLKKIEEEDDDDERLWF
ncbi:hypothetical protein KY290_002608 [Solanum tuberosum]|uniref:Disease resistance R13L4/SHOC-2-like LRR domain-containing protein n=1 Tax=Solanum tuberosum TaxID=4113 RepID=A0ABQ7WQJ9_SOLTU|nr:hypothetical protein KY290_002608 [Solanum tuberosum]